MIKRVCLFVVLFSLSLSASAAVRVPSLFSDHMVLQAGVKVPVWGWGESGEDVTVAVGGQECHAKVGEHGKWKVLVEPLAKSTKALSMTISGSKTDVPLKIEDILVGEVWLGSGQSNMKMAVAGCENADAEISGADYPEMRLFTVGPQASDTLAEDVQGTWQVCSPETVRGFSAAAYFFGRELHRELKCPVGLIASAWGGTSIEAWTPLDAQKGLPELQPVLRPWEERVGGHDSEPAKKAFEVRMEKWQAAAKQAKADGKKPPRKPRAPVDPRLDPNRPANLYNGMIHPLIPYAMRGAIWYQGERNTRGAASALYGLQLETLITSWRSAWRLGDFPFIYAQLPNYETTRNWSVVQEQMLKTLVVRNTGMAVTIDVGMAKNIHPKNKQAVGRRLALWALAKSYGRDIVYSGPLYRVCERKRNALTVSFDHVADGLVAKDGELVGFEVAGEDKVYAVARATIVGKAVEVSSANVAAPVAVRYAWGANPTCNLFNSAGLPASPFRSDDWALEMTE